MSSGAPCKQRRFFEGSADADADHEEDRACFLRKARLRERFCSILAFPETESYELTFASAPFVAKDLILS